VSAMGIFLMAGAHVGHDSTVGNNVITRITPCWAATSQVGDNAFLGGGSSYQHTRVGRIWHRPGCEWIQQGPRSLLPWARKSTIVAA